MLPNQVIGTFFLYRLDVALLRQAVRVVNHTLGSLQLEKHQD
jgi:hypothetical protein